MDLQFLSAIKLFQKLSESELEILANAIEIKEIKKGEIIYSPGDTRDRMRMVYSGKVQVIAQTADVEEASMVYATQMFFNESAILTTSSRHTAECISLEDTVFYTLPRDNFRSLFSAQHEVASKILLAIGSYMFSKLHGSTATNPFLRQTYSTGKTRHEHDLLGDMEVPREAYYGIQTLRARYNFNITGVTLSAFPQLIKGFTLVKKAAARANARLNLLPENLQNYIEQACDEIYSGHFHEQFVVDMIQGGAGTSTNMNINEVIANRALELAGKKKGDYAFIHPNNHVNMSQSTNDAYPTSVRVACLQSIPVLTEALKELCDTFGAKAEEFSDVVKMGRTQLQDAVPMTLGQEFDAYRATIAEDIHRMNEISHLFYEVNMGGTAIGTGINSHPDYARTVIEALREVTGLPLVTAPNLIEASFDTGAFVLFSGMLKRTAVKLSKICSDLRLLSSGPRCGLNEINLPPMQPGSSIMPGKVNPVIPEVVNQVCFQVIGNDLTISMAAEHGQLQLNVMEPVIVFNLFQSINMLNRATRTLSKLCVSGITANRDVCRRNVENSIGLATALNPYIGYEQSTSIAAEALKTGDSIFNLVLKYNLMSREQLEDVLKPENMVKFR